MKNLYIFDLDGTLSLTTERQKILANEDNPNRWPEFFEACDTDTPNQPIIDTMELLHSAGADVWIFSGRTDAVRGKTEKWLHKHTMISGYLVSDCDSLIKMRKEGDYTPDDVLKDQWLNEMSANDRQRLIAVFDDRAKVVAMWRANEVACLQVAPGDF